MERDIFFDTSGKKKTLIYMDGGTKTVYIGKGANRVKIYNKAAEQGIEDEKDWTRYEVSMKVNEDVRRLNKFEYKADLPNIYMIKYFKYDNSLSDTDWCILQGIINGAYNISDLGRRKAKKIRSVLEKQTQFKPDNWQLSEVLRKYIISSSLNNIISYYDRKPQKDTFRDNFREKDNRSQLKTDKMTIREILKQKGLLKEQKATIKE